jgi:hypothetical protein
LPPEVCDWQDNDCNTFEDEGCDVHGDGDGQTRRQGDCNDNDATVYWGAPELCDAKDNNCNGYVDDAASCIPSETEANNTRQTCTPMRWPGRIDGVVTSSTDADFFCVVIGVANTRLGFDVDARDLASPLDPLLEIYDSAGTRLASNNSGFDPDTNVMTADPYIPFTFEVPGTYTVVVKASSGAGAGAFYRLFTEVLGGCLDLDKDGVTSCAGDCNDFNSSVGPGAIDVCDGADNDCDGSADELCVGTCLDDNYEQNDTMPTATPVLANEPSLSATYCGGDNDYHALPLTAGDEAQVVISFLNAEGNLSLQVYDTDGDVVLGQSLTTNDFEEVIFTAPLSGTYFVRVFGPLSARNSYSLLVRSPPN